MSLARLMRVAAIVLLLPRIAWAGPETLTELEKGAVAIVKDGDSFRMQGDNVDVRLIGLRAPEIAKGRRNFVDQPLGEEAHRALETLLRGHTVSLRVGAHDHDRNGRILAYAIRDDGMWLETEVLREGWARVYTFPDNRAFAGEVHSFEISPRMNFELQTILATANFKRINLHPFGLSGHSGSADVTMSDHAHLACITNVAGENTMRVPVCRLDDLALAPPDLIKIDVEDHESTVLEAASTLIGRHRPGILF